MSRGHPVHHTRGNSQQDSPTDHWSDPLQRSDTDQAITNSPIRQFSEASARSIPRDRDHDRTNIGVLFHEPASMDDPQAGLTETGHNQYQPQNNQHQHQYQPQNNQHQHQYHHHHHQQQQQHPASSPPIMVHGTNNINGGYIHAMGNEHAMLSTSPVHARPEMRPDHQESLANGGSRRPNSRRRRLPNIIHQDHRTPDQGDGDRNGANRDGRSNRT